MPSRSTVLLDPLAPAHPAHPFDREPPRDCPTRRPTPPPHTGPAAFAPTMAIVLPTVVPPRLERRPAPTSVLPMSMLPMSVPVPHELPAFLPPRAAPPGNVVNPSLPTWSEIAEPIPRGSPQGEGIAVRGWQVVPVGVRLGILVVLAHGIALAIVILRLLRD